MARRAGSPGLPHARHRKLSQICAHTRHVTLNALLHTTRVRRGRFLTGTQNTLKWWLGAFS